MSPARRSPLLRVSALLLALALAGCSVFDESLRRTPTESTPPAAPTDGPPQAGDCVIEVSAKSGVGRCGGVGGGPRFGSSETEPNEEPPQALDAGEAVCGSVTASNADHFSISTSGCLSLDAELGPGVKLTLSIGGAVVRELATTGGLNLETTPGDVLVEVTGAGTYRLVVER